VRKNVLFNIQKYEGVVFPTSNFGDVVVIKYTNNRKITVKFLDTSYVRDVRLVDLQRGEVRDYAVPSVYNVGVFDMHDFKNETKTQEYSLWSGVLERCYSKINSKYLKNYKDCEASECFKYYSKFKKWCNTQVGFNSKDDKGNSFHLDKDILIKGNKIYSEDTCCFVPQEINCLFINSKSARGDNPVGVHQKNRNEKFGATCSIGGCQKFLGYYSTTEEAFQAYKETKEAYIKEVANKWKDQIDSRVYEALMNWSIEITD